MRRLLLALLMVAASGSALADRDHERAHRLRDMGDILPLEAILERVERERPGRLLELDLEREHGRWVYELEWLGDDGQVRELLYDATSGEFLGEEE